MGDEVGAGGCPCAAKQDVDSYVVDRFSELVPVLQSVFDIGANKEVSGFLELLVRNEYWRERCAVLEHNLKAFVRYYLAAFALIQEMEPGLSEEEIKGEVKRNLGDVGEIEALPSIF